MTVAPIKKNKSSLPEHLAINCEDITVAYRSYEERPTSLKESILQTVKNRGMKYYSTFDALKNINIEVRRGDVMGIVGSNGSGKSTLLKIFSGVLHPTKGSIAMSGEIASLIELGAGFDSELNAIENIYLNGSLHRIPKAEIKKRVPKILEFSELQDFATTPIKYYSSGMYARLGFSVAVDIDPDILLIDEILGVGDERFQLKCQKVFEDFSSSGKTLVIVSHDLEMLKDVANRVVLLSKGEVIFDGAPERALDIYRSDSYQTALSA